MSDHDDDYTVGTLELFECARVNFENVQKMAPAIGVHPIWAIAMDQLATAIARLEKEGGQ